MANALTDPAGAEFPPARFSGEDPLPRPKDREDENTQHDPSNKNGREE